MRLPILLFGVIITLSTSSPADSFDALRLRWKESLTGGAGLDPADPDIGRSLNTLASSAQTVWDRMERADNRAFLWSDLAGMTTNSAHITSTCERLRTLALAYATRGSILESNMTLRADLLGALDWMNANRYNKSKSEYANWWDWEIGTPLALNDLTVLLYDDLSAAQVADFMGAVDRFTPKPTKTAANLVWQATVVAVRGVIVKNSSKIALGRDALSQVFLDATSGDGFYADGSFLQHEIHPYAGGYGNSLLGSIVLLMHLLNGSSWAVTDSNRTNVFRWMNDAYQPLIYRGAMMDMVRGREIARRASSDHAIGASVIASMLRAASFAPPAEALALQRMAKYWMETDTARDFVAGAALPVIPLAKNLLRDTNVAARGELLGHFRFPRMDRVVHLRPGFGVGLSLSSSRIGNYESINAENLHGWFTGDGMLYLYNNDLAQFSDHYWPTANPYRLPGTTVDTRPRADASGQSYRGAYNWVGGASLGVSGVAGMQLDAWGSTLTAKKSWFLFDNEIVALGTGITSADQSVIETTVENRKLTDTGDNSFLVNGEPQLATLDGSAALANVSWAHLAGNVPGADLGYYFPQPTTLKGIREARTNLWSQINGKSGSSTLVARNYLTLWLDHGVNPANAGYAYVLLPNKSPAEVAGYAASPDIVILENSSRAQAVRETRLNLTAANFWNDGAATVAGITVDKKSSVMMQTSGTELEVAISDPTQANKKKITVEFDRAATRLLSADAGVTVVALSPRVKLSVNVKSAAGRVFRARFQLVSTPGVALKTIAFAPDNEPVQPALADGGSSSNEIGETAPAAGGPPRLTVQPFAADRLLLSWPTNLPGCRLQVQTNTSFGGLGTNWIDVLDDATPPFLVPVSKTAPGVFYRLKSP